MKDLRFLAGQRHLFLKSALISSIMMTAALIQSQPAGDLPGVGTPRVIKVHKKVIAVVGLYHPAGKAGVNAGIIAAPNSLVFIDAGMSIPSAEFLWKTAQEQFPGKQNVYLVLTHHHSDHVFGMRIFREKKANIIAHKGVADELRNDQGFYKKFIAEKMGWDSKKADEILGNIILGVPDRVIEQDTVFNIDGDAIHLLVTPGHVPDEIVVYHPSSKILFAGDSVYQGMEPTTRFGSAAAWQVWVHQLERLKKLDIKMVCPGHGELCSADEIDRNIDFLKNRLTGRIPAKIETQGARARGNLEEKS